MHGRGDVAAIRRLFLRMSKYCVAVALPLVATLAACREWLLTLWMGERFTAAGPAVLALLATFYITSHNHGAYSVLGGKRRLGPLVYVATGPQAVLNLALSVALVSRLGVLGVALGTLVPALVLQPFFMRFALREIGVSFAEFVREVVVPTSGLAIPTFLPLVAATLVTGPGAWVRMPIAVVCCAMFAVAFWLRGLDAEERSAVPGLLPFGLGQGWQARLDRQKV
jgi:O-antigen/teichoic acid export membrane protein